MVASDPLGWLGAVIDGQFAVESIAGEGGFGIVYRGLHLGLSAPVAIKCLKIPAHLDADARRSFLDAFQREARLLHRLSTRTTGIVQALDVGAASSPTGLWTPYTVMEWLDGETLALELAQRPAGRSLQEAMELLAPVAAALELAHDESVSHRDIKPANIFLVRTRRAVLTKILDFGLAKVLSENPSVTRTRDGEGFRAFTPLYGAPEQFSADFGVTGPWTDVYALGLVLIEAVSGKPALVGDNIFELFNASCNAAHRPSLAARRPEVGGAVEAVIRKAVEVRPADRFRGAGEMWDALEGARKIALVATVTTSSSTPLVSWASPVGPQPITPPRAGAPASTGENRICTILVADLFDATALAARLDPGEVKEILERCLHVIAASIEALGGFVDRIGSGGAVGVFGAQGAHESDAERAIHAAIRIKGAIGKVPLPRAARPWRPMARIGISTGRVFAERALGPEGEGFSVVGEALLVAGRLQQAAAPGAIVIGRDTWRNISGRFNVEPLAPLSSAGSGEPIPAYRVLGPVVLQHAFSQRDFHGLDTRLVGRNTELDRLLDALHAVVGERRAAIVTLVGPPGVGRSRMLAELVSSITVGKQPFVVMAGQGSALATGTSHGLTASLLRRRFAIAEDDAPDVILRRLRCGMRWLRIRLGREAAAAEPGLLADAMADDEPRSRRDSDDALVQLTGLLDTRKAPRIAPIDAWRSDDEGAQAKHRLAAAAARLVAFVAERAPVVILCDDAQWADDASLDLLDDLALRVEGLPVLVVFAARPDLYDRRPHWGEGKAGHRRIDLVPLERRHVEEMIRDRLRRMSTISPELVRTLVERAEGNPLILDETMRLLADAGVIEVRGTEGTWLLHEHRLGTLALPATIQGVVQARLDRLAPPARALLARAAVVGRTFWEGAIERLERADGQLASGPTTAEILADLRRRQLVRAREATTFPGEREWVFAESATQEVAYEMLPARVRRPLHLHVATWLKERAPGSAGAALLALHLDRGDDAARAAEEYVRAAAHASSLGQNAEALRHLLRARELHEMLEDEAAGESVPDVSWRDRVRQRLDLGDVLRRLGRLDEAETAYEEARSRVPRADREAPRWEARADFRLALTHKVRGSTAEARRIVQRAIDRAIEGGIIDETPAMYALLTFLYRRERRHDESCLTGLLGLRACRAIPPGDARRPENVARALLGLAPVLHTRRRWVAAERTYRQAARVAAAAGDLDLLGRALNGLAATRLSRGDPADARATFLRSLRVKEKAGDLHQIAVAYSNVAEVEIAMREFAAALEHARRGVRLGEQIDAGSDLAEMYRNLGEASLGLGDVGAALHACLRALDVAEEAGPLYLGDAALSLARACARAAKVAPEGSPLLARANEAGKTLEAVLDRSFTDGDLRERAEACRALLGGHAS